MTSIRSDSPVAIVTGANHPTGLGAGRALYQSGVYLIGMTARSNEAPVKSRVWRELHSVDGDAEEWLRKVREVSDRVGRPVYLLPTQDRLVEEFSRHRGELGENVRIALPPHPVVELMLDKTKFHHWARSHGYPVPDSFVASSSQELHDALARIRYPAILKPLYRTPAWDRLSPNAKAFKLGSASDIGQVAFPLFEAAPAYLLSQWIEGPDSAVHYCLAHCASPGKIEASATGRKLLQYPRQTGSTAVCVGTENEPLRVLTAEIFAQSGFVGLGSLEVKYDADGQPWITEPTVGRPNLQSYSAFAQGVDLYGMALRHALGRQWPLAARPRRNAVWLEERHLIELTRGGSGATIPWRQVTAEAGRVKRVAFAYWAWWDPAPALALAWSMVGRALRKARSITASRKAQAEPPKE